MTLLPGDPPDDEPDDSDPYADVFHEARAELDRWEADPDG